MGVDVITLGNHAWDQREALVGLTHASTSRRPADSRTSKTRKGS
jgi:calcineurin-like phosphoesterase